MRKRPAAVLRGALLATALVAPAAAGDPSGDWLTQDGEAKVRIASCGAAMCGSVVWLKQPVDLATGRPMTDKNNPDARKRDVALIGVEVLVKLVPSGPDKWAGPIYDPENGKTYSGSITLLSLKTLRVEGCLLLLCDAEVWTKSN